MKKTTLAFGSLLCLATAGNAQITNPAPYCAAGFDDGTPGIPMHYISNVTLGTLNNSTGTTLTAAPHYTFFNQLTAPALKQGSSYPISVTHDPMPNTIHFVAVYIDFNHNNSFADEGERVLQQSMMVAGQIQNPSTTNITIPANATIGTTRMRVMVFEDDMYTLGGNNTNATPCTVDADGMLDWGETEDYNVNITAATPTAINEVKLNAADMVYPNPAKDILYMKAGFAGADIAISDLQGRVVLQQKALKQNKIDIAALPNGIYILRMTKENIVYNQKLVVDK